MRNSDFEANRGNPSRVMTVNELADFLRVHRSTVYRLLKTNSLPAFRVGSDWRFNTETVNEWMQRKQGRN
jgi:excisionase family DNA binding protein